MNKSSLIFAGLLLILLNACESRLPVISTLPVTDITSSTAVSGGNIEDEGDAPVVSRGIIWGKNEPTLDSYSGLNSEGTGPGIFESLMTGLEQNTLYMVRAFASNKFGTVYGRVFKFTTSGKPPVTPGKASLTTEWPTDLTSTSVKLNGNIISDGGSNVTERGFYFGTSSTPQSDGSRLAAGSGTGFFSLTRTGLSVNTTYYYCAYAINAAGMSLGSVIYFSTNITAGVQKVFNSSLTYGSVEDIDGNEYRTIKIGNQEWMAEDLKVSRLNDGTVIQNITENNNWGTLVTLAYCWYNNNTAYKENFGALYNWFTVETGKLCPTGWHVPSDNEWTVLTDYLGGADVAGGKLKETGFYHWNFPNQGATNSSGFTALPTGARKYPEGHFYGVGVHNSWWSSTEYNYLKPYYRSVYYLNTTVFRGFGTLKGAGIAIRCLKD